MKQIKINGIPYNLFSYGEKQDNPIVHMENTFSEITPTDDQMSLLVEFLNEQGVNLSSNIDIQTCVEEALQIADKANSSRFGSFNSWTIKNNLVCIKKADKSFFDYNQSGIPAEIRWFFGTDNMNNNERQEYIFHYEGNSYKAFIQCEINDSVRTRMSWDSELGKALSKYNDPNNYPEIAFKQIKDEEYEIEINEESNMVRDKGKEEFWPSYEEYPVDISKDEWKRFIEEVEYSHKGSMRVLKCYVDIGGVASCKKMAQRYKGHPSVYISSISNTCKRALKYFNMDACEDDKRDTQWQFPICFQGRRGKGEDSGTYVYKIREQLAEALKEIDLREINLDYKTGENKMSKEQYDKNLILYGPPGTGKTYNTVKYAVAICDGVPVESLTDYEEAKIRFNVLKEEKRIAFTTFHQSYGYEEFIEGIKPVIGDETGDISYNIEAGVFKKFCKYAQNPTVEDKKYGLTKENPRIWGMILGGTGSNPIKTECFNNNIIRIGFNNVDDEDIKQEYATDEKSSYSAKHMVDDFINTMEVGDIIVVEKSKKSIEAVGIVAGDYVFDENREDYRRSRAVKWIVTDLNQDITGYLPSGRVQLAISTLFNLDYIGIEAIYDILAINDKEGFSVEVNTKPCVFIIDEINRGNISKIFGELITLIEDTKRKGLPEEASAILPYSNESFSVPNNVYILGTMNTADRSITLMDTALRRRFQFKEMMPNVEVLRGIGADKVEDLDVAAMLKTINERITFLYDREHTIGHAFFTGLKDEPTIKKLASIFLKSVIPLLQEYFYEDYQKIQFVLGDNGKSDDKYKFIKDIPVVAKNIFKGSVDDIVDLPEKKYVINTDAFFEIQSYKEIM